MDGCPCDDARRYLKFLSNKEILQIKKIDDQLKSTKEHALIEDNVKLGSNVTDSVSWAMYYAMAKAFDPVMPFMPLFKSTALREFKPGFDKIPKLMFTVLNGGKDSGSKVKFRKFFVIFDVNFADARSVNV